MKNKANNYLKRFTFIGIILGLSFSAQISYSQGRVAVINLGDSFYVLPVVKNPVGILDSTFGADGIVVYDTGENAEGRSITHDTAGNIYITGSSDYNMTIWKYTSEGVLDNSFGLDGIVVHNDILVYSGYGNSIALDKSNNVYVTGSMTIWKYTSEGVLDNSFGLDGVVDNVSCTGNSIILDTAGNVYVAGYKYDWDDGNYDMAICKYTSEGVLDSTFGTDGIVIDGTVGGYHEDIGNSITLDSAGNVYVTGYSFGDSMDMVIWKYTNEGVLDSTFGIDGIVVQHSATGGLGYDIGYDIKLDAAGNVYVVGYSQNGDFVYSAMMIWKYTSKGVLDSSFGTDGIVVHNGAAGGNDDSGQSVILDTVGNVYVTGSSRDSSLNTYMAIWKYTSEGVLDNSFGLDGIVYSAAADGNSTGGESITLDSLGHVYVTGSSAVSNNMLIWKYK